MLVWSYADKMPQSSLKKGRENSTELFLCKTIPYFCSLILNQTFFLPISKLKNGRGVILREAYLEAFSIPPLFKCRMPMLTKYFQLLWVGRRVGSPRQQLC